MQKKPNTEKKYKLTGRRARAFPDLQMVALERHCSKSFERGGTSFYIESPKNLSQLGDSFFSNWRRSVSLGNRRHNSITKGNYVYTDNGELYLQIGSILRAGIFRYCRS